MSHAKNPAEIEWWTKLLNEGHRLACSAGRDWHFPDGVVVTPDGTLRQTSAPKFLSCTYLGVDESLPIEEAAVDALRAGRTYVTLGPTVAVEAAQRGKRYGIAGVMENGVCDVRVEVGVTERREVWEKDGIVPQKVRLIGRAGEWEAKLENGSAVFLDLPIDGWMRAEVYGQKGRKEGELLAVTSPIYAE